MHVLLPRQVREGDELHLQPLESGDENAGDSGAGRPQACSGAGSCDWAAGVQVFRHSHWLQGRGSLQVSPPALCPRPGFHWRCPDQCECVHGSSIGRQPAARSGNPCRRCTDHAACIPGNGAVCTPEQLPRKRQRTRAGAWSIGGGSKTRVSWRWWWWWWWW